VENDARVNVAGTESEFRRGRLISRVVFNGLAISHADVMAKRRAAEAMGPAC
jgi:hypothetical protein